MKAERSTTAGTWIDLDLLRLALALGLVSGLVEGVGHMVLQRLNVLENVWYQIIWISALFNGALLGALGVVLSLGLSLFTDRTRPRHVAVWLLVLAAGLPCFALMLKNWMKMYAILVLLLGTTVVVTRWIRGHKAATARLSRRGLPWLITITLLTVIGIQGGFWLRERQETAALPAADRSAPNILMIVIDTLRSDHVSAYGYARSTSPTIDRLAKDGVLFEQAFAASSYTLPSHASMLTGLYPHEHGVEWGTSHRSQSYPTIAETLKSRGYRTGAFSGNTNYFSREHGFGRGFIHFEDFFHSLTDMVARTAYGRIVTTTALVRLGYTDTPGRKHAYETNRAVLSWVGEQSPHPYFVVINYMDVHDPYMPPPPYREKFSSLGASSGLINQNLDLPASLSATELQGEIDAYDGAIAYTDDQIGQLLRGLEQPGNGRELLVVVTSDHGEEFFEHGSFIHGYHLYREVVQVPLIFWLPGRIPGGVRVSQPVSNAAIPATLMQALGDREAVYPGPPLQQLWNASETPASWPSPLAELKQRPWAPANEPVRHGSLRSMVSGVWHYIEHDGDGRHLFDLGDDAREAKDLAKDPGSQPTADALGRQLHVERERKARTN